MIANFFSLIKLKKKIKSNSIDYKDKTDHIIQILISSRCDLWGHSKPNKSKHNKETEKIEDATIFPMNKNKTKKKTRTKNTLKKMKQPTGGKGNLPDVFFGTGWEVN